MRSFGKTLLVLAINLAAVLNYKQSDNVDNGKEELEKYISEERVKVGQRYRLTYHVAAPIGWINDPNGFSYFNGEFHLFYQYYPYDSKWGPMHWGHVSSNNLVYWKNRPVALLPEEEQCFSGSAVRQDDKLVLMYTGHVETNTEPFYKQNQYLAFSSDGVNFEKYKGNPVIMAPNEIPDFRDPKMWRHGLYWYVIIGSKTDDGRGNVLLYRSIDIIEWEFLTVLAESDGEMGYMWECPDFFQLDGMYILLMSPQGLLSDGDKFRNLYQTGYVIGNFNYDTYEFTPTQEFKELDLGHDFYAAQTQEVVGRRLLISWFGMWDVEFPEAADGWAGAMTIVRELKLINNNTIVQRPVEEMELLRGSEIRNGEININDEVDYRQAAEIFVHASKSRNVSLLFRGRQGGGNITINWDPEVSKVIVDRNNDVRQVHYEPVGDINWRIFLDTSSVELFCDDGVVVFSSRVYPLGGWVMSNLSDQRLTVVSYALKRGVPE